MRNDLKVTGTKNKSSNVESKNGGKINSKHKQSKIVSINNTNKSIDNLVNKNLGAFIYKSYYNKYKKQNGKNVEKPAVTRKKKPKKPTNIHEIEEKIKQRWKFTKNSLVS